MGQGKTYQNKSNRSSLYKNPWIQRRLAEHALGPEGVEIPEDVGIEEKQAATSTNGIDNEHLSSVTSQAQKETEENNTQSTASTNEPIVEALEPTYGSDIKIDTPLTEEQKERYNWDEALSIFKEENPGVGNANLNMWLRKNLKLGWKVGDFSVPNIRDIEITIVTDYWKNKPFEVWHIKAYSYDDAYGVVTDENYKGLWYWITPIMETKSGLQRKGAISDYNKNNYGYLNQNELNTLLEKLYDVCKDKTAYDNAKKSSYAGNFDFIVLVKAVQNKFWGDDKDRVTGMLTPLTMEKVNAAFDSKIKTSTTSYQDDKQTLITKLFYVSGDLKLYQAAVDEQIKNELVIGPQAKQHIAFQQLVRSAQEVLFDSPSEWTGEIEKDSKTYVAVDQWGKQYTGNVSAMDNARMNILVKREYDKYSIQRDYYEQQIKSKQISLNYYEENDPENFHDQNILRSEILRLNIELNKFSWKGIMNKYANRQNSWDEDKYISGHEPVEHDVSEYPLKNPFGNNPSDYLSPTLTLDLGLFNPDPDTKKQTDKFYQGFENAPQTSLKRQITNLDEQSHLLRGILSSDYQNLSTNYEQISNKTLSISTTEKQDNLFGKYIQQPSSTITRDNYSTKPINEDPNYKLRAELKNLNNAVTEKLKTLKETDPEYKFLKTFSFLSYSPIYGSGKKNDKLEGIGLKKDNGGNYSITELYKIAEHLIDIDLANKLLPKGNLRASSLNEISERQHYLEKQQYTVGKDAITIPTYIVLDEKEKDLNTYIGSPGFTTPTPKENTLLNNGIPLNVFVKHLDSGKYKMWLDMGSSMKHAEVSASSQDEALLKLFKTLKGENVFPNAKLYYIDSAKNIQWIKTSGGHWSWGEILGAISIGLMILSIPFTAGGSLLASEILFSASVVVGVAGEGLTLHEKSEAGTLSAGDVALGSLNILAMLLPGIGVLGKATKVSKSFGGITAVIEGNTFKAISYGVGATDALVQTCILSDDFIEQYNKLPSNLSEQERREAIIRLLATSLALGVLTIHSFRSDVKNLNSITQKEVKFGRYLDNGFSRPGDLPQYFNLDNNVSYASTKAGHEGSTISKNEFSVTRNNATTYYTKEDFLNKINAGEFDLDDVIVKANTNDPNIQQALRDYEVRNKDRFDVNTKKNSNFGESSLEGVNGVKISTKIDNFVTEIAKVNLPPSVASTFENSIYKTVTTNQNVVLNRAFGNQVYLKGGFATTKANATRGELALLDEWNNSMRFEATIQVPAGETLNIGKVAPQTSSNGLQTLSGLGDQILLPQNWNYQNWVTKVTDKTTGIEYTYGQFQKTFPNMITP